MPELQYRTEDDRLNGKEAAHVSGDPFHPQTEAQRVAEAAKALPEARNDYPKWVEPDKSRVVVDQVSGAVHVPGFQSFVNRHDKKVTVLVQNEEEEKRATSETEAAKLQREAAIEKSREENPT